MKEWKAVTEPLGRLAARMKGDKRIELAVYVLLAALGILVYTASCGKEAEEATQAAWWKPQQKPPWKNGWRRHCPAYGGRERYR